MKSRILALYSCLIISTACLGAGYFWAGYWQFAPVLLVTCLLWTKMKKRIIEWSDTSFLVIYTVLAAVGVVAGLSIELMIIASVFTLASWDLLRFEQSIVGKATFHTGSLFEKHHLRSLVMTMVTGLLFAMMSLYVHLQLSFVAIVSLVLLALSGLAYGVQYIQRTKR